MSELLANARSTSRSGLSTAAGIVAVVVAATSVFAERQSALHRIWRSQPRTVVQGLWHALRVRLLSFGLVLGAEFTRNFAYAHGSRPGRVSAADPSP